MTDDGRTDEALIAGTLGGDQGAYAVLVSRYQGIVFRTVYWLCGDREECDDLVQEVFVRAYFALPTHDLSRPLAPWLLTIARNLCFTNQRRRRHLASPEKSEKQLAGARDSRPSPAAVLEGEELRQRVWHAVDDLPDEYREIVLLRHLSELSYEEISRVTGLPMGTVKSRLNRGRRLLACALAGERIRPG